MAIYDAQIKGSLLDYMRKGTNPMATVNWGYWSVVGIDSIQPMVFDSMGMVLSANIIA